MKRISRKQVLVGTLSAVMALGCAMPAMAAEGWKQNSTGWWYEYNDGSYVVSDWKQVDGQWYYFDEDGFVQTGWKYVGDKWYYLNSDGQMLTGWQHINDRWYYLNDNGDMAIGWVQSEPGKWYYLYTDGSMAVNTTIDGLYYVDSSGMWIQ